MCYRYTLRSFGALKDFCGEPAAAATDWQPRYNVALTNLIPVVAQRTRPAWETMSFGFNLPARTEGERPLLLGNARAEGLLTKPSFRDAAKHRRCLVPADGFYEWEKAGTARLPHFLALANSQPFFFAALWNPARDSAPAAFCIVTTTPNALLSSFHDRMPVILENDAARAWLGDTPLDPAQLAALCQPFAADQMVGYRVDPRVNNVRYQSPDCVVPLRTSSPSRSEPTDSLFPNEDF